MTNQIKESTTGNDCNYVAKVNGVSCLTVRGERLGEDYDYIPSFSVEVKKDNVLVFFASMDFFPKRQMRSQEEAFPICDSQSSEWGETAFLLFIQRKKKYPVDAIALCSRVSLLDVKALQATPGLMAACFDAALQVQRRLYPREKCQYMVYFGSTDREEDDPFCEEDKLFKKLCRRDGITLISPREPLCEGEGCYLATRMAPEMKTLFAKP